MKQKRHRFLGACLTLALALGLTAIPTASAAEAVGPTVGAWGVDNALAPGGSWDQLDAGEEQWYAFYYAGDGSQIQVHLEATPEGSAGFVVWTPKEIQRWAIGKRVTPIGRSSDDPVSAGNLIWSGNFTAAGTYYVVVEHSGNPAGTSYYRLSVKGEGVSTAAPAQADTPASTTTATSEPAPSQPRSALASELSGTLVFQTTYGGPFYTIDTDGSDLQRITNGIDPVWSPDGGQIAFVRWEEPRGVWVIDVESGSEYRVFDWSETRHPSWSPAGELVFSRQHGTVDSGGGRPPSPGGRRGGGPPGGAGPGGGTWQLGIVDPGDGSFREPLPNSDTNLTPDWSPDGQQIVFAGQHGLIVQSTDGQEAWQLTSDPKDASPVWSPDGEQVAFVHRQHDHWEIYVVDVATGRQTRLTDTLALADGAAANSVSPAWSPDGNYLAFLTDRAEGRAEGRAGEWEIWVMAADGSDPGPLFGAELDGLTLDYAFAGERAIDWAE